MHECPECSAYSIHDLGSKCPNCGADLTKYSKGSTTQGGTTVGSPTPGPAPNEGEILAGILAQQKEQTRLLREISKHTGCLYTYLILSLIFGVIATVIYFIFLAPIR